MTPQVSSPCKSETLHFGYGDTSLGIIAVAESAHGVVALFIGNNRAKLLHDLQSAFPEAEIILDQAGLAPTVAKATALVEEPHLGTDLKLDLRGSPLEVAVWNALQSIARGRYSHLRRDREGPASSGDGSGRGCSLRGKPNRYRRALPSRR